MLLISSDELLIERLARYCRNNPSILITSTPSAAFHHHYDAVLIPASELLDPLFPREATIRRLSAGGCSLICYGPSELLPACFLAGCDDYLREPWSPEELEWRLHRLRRDRITAYSFTWGRLELDSLELRSAGGSCSLCPQEQSILRLLAANRGEPVSREALYYGIWGRPASGESRVVDMHVSSLRRKLLRLFPQNDGCIRSVRGVGYLMAR